MENKEIKNFNDPLMKTNKKLTIDDLFAAKDGLPFYLKKLITDFVIVKSEELSDHKVDRIIKASNNLISLLNEV